MNTKRFKRLEIEQDNLKLTHNTEKLVLETKDGSPFQIRQEGDTLQIITNLERNLICTLDEKAKIEVENFIGNLVPETKQQEKFYDLLNKWVQEGDHFRGQKVYSIEFPDKEPHSSKEWEKLCEDFNLKDSHMISLPEYCFLVMLEEGCKNHESILTVVKSEEKQKERYSFVDFSIGEYLNGGIIPFDYPTKLYMQSFAVIG